MVQLLRYALGSLKSRPVNYVLDLDLYSGLSDFSGQQKALVQHLGADTGSSGPCWGKKEHTASVHVPLMIGTEVSHSLGILASADNLISYVRVDGNGNMSSILTD